MLKEYNFKSVKFNLIRIKLEFVKRILIITWRFILILKQYLIFSKFIQWKIK